MKGTMPDGIYMKYLIQVSGRSRYEFGMAACFFEQDHFATGLAVFATGTGY
jgi:hypothetical protein